MTTWITVCDTCRRQDTGPAAGRETDGKTFARLIEATAERTEGKVRVRRQSCLWSCPRACNVLVQAKGKVSYSLGNFAPEQGNADAVVDYALAHADSESGQVPFRDWPNGVRGHFVSRQFPLPEDMG